MIDFENSCAVVTGAAGGIGRSLARALAAQGARVAVADISGEGAAATAAAIGGGARGYGCDVSDMGQMEALAAAVAQDFGPASFAFANAGVYLSGPLLDTEPREFEWLFDVNVRGVFNTLKVFAPMLLAEGGAGRPARFILTGSENSVGLPRVGVNTAYTATKHALLAMADGLRRDLDGSGVGVSILCPGAVNTDILDSRRVRQEGYGGNQPAPPETIAAVRERMAAIAQDPDVTARVCLEGIANDEFIIIADPKIRLFAPDRHREVEAALDKADARLGANKALS